MLNFVFYDATFPGRFEEGGHVGERQRTLPCDPNITLAGLSIVTPPQR
jgi:hypothetical protein